MAFSGGVDSSLLATICKDAGYKVTLLTVGFDGSHDVEFTSKVSTKLGALNEWDVKHDLHRIIYAQECI